MLSHPPKCTSRPKPWWFGSTCTLRGMVQYKHIFFSRTTIQWYEKKFAASLISGFTFTMACLLYLPSTCLPTLHPRISGSQPTAPSPLSLHAAESKITWMNNKLKWIKVSWSPPPPNSHYKLLSLNKHRVAESLESALGSARERILSHSHWCHQVQPNSTLNNKKTQSSAHLINPCFIYNRNHIKYLNWIVTNTFWIQR